MKLPFTFFLIFILTCQNTFGQLIETTTDVPPQEQNKFITQTQYDFYSLKQKRQETAAWICLGGGAAMTITGLILTGNSTRGKIDDVGEFGQRLSEGLSGGFFTIVGGAATITSIPLFISAGKNKRKASLSIKGEPLSFGKLNSRKSQLFGGCSHYRFIGVFNIINTLKKKLWKFQLLIQDFTSRSSTYWHLHLCL